MFFVAPPFTPSASRGCLRTLRVRLYPFGEPPAMTQTLMDIHEHKAFVVKDFKVVQQGDYVLLASPYFASSGGSVVDWEPLKNDDGVHVAAMPDEL